MHVLALSLGRTILEPHSRERERMSGYAHALSSYHLIVLTRRRHGFTESVHEGNLHIYPTNSRSRFMMLVDAYRMAKHITPETPSVVTAQDPFLIGLTSLFIARAKRARFHVQLHGDYFDSPFWHHGSPIKFLTLWFTRYTMNHACGIRVVSERIKRSLIKIGISEDRITVLPIRPELEKFLNVVRRETPRDTLTFLIMSRFSKEKNIPMMLHAFAKVYAGHPRIHLRLCGRGSEETRIRECIQKLGIESAVTIVSWTEQPEIEYADADVFLLGSDHEAYGLTLVEALAAGLPVVTTDVGCVGEIVEHDVHGIVVPPRDEDAFTHALERMIHDEAFRAASGRAGKETARSLATQSQDAYIHAWVASLHTGEEAV